MHTAVTLSMFCGSVDAPLTSRPLGGNGRVREGMHDGAKKGVRSGILVCAGARTGGCWGKGIIALHFQMRTFLLLGSTSAPIKQVGNHATSPLLGTRRRHRLYRGYLDHNVDRLCGPKIKYSTLLLTFAREFSLNKGRILYATVQNKLPKFAGY